MKRPNPQQTLDRAQNAALQAQAALDDPALRAAFEHLSEHYTNAMRRSLPADRDGREAAYYMLRALDALASDLARVISGAELARRNYRHVLHAEDKLQ
jgi:hypothetical protein